MLQLFPSKSSSCPTKPLFPNLLFIFRCSSLENITLFLFGPHLVGKISVPPPGTELRHSSKITKSYPLDHQGTHKSIILNSVWKAKSSLSCLSYSHPFHQATFSEFKTVVYNDFPSKTCSPRALSHWSLQWEIFLNCFQCQLCEGCLKGRKPIESEDSRPSRLVLIPCLVTGGEHRDSSTSSAPSSAFLGLWFLC